MADRKQPGAGALESLRDITAERYSLDRREYSMIQSAHVLGAPWERIAKALGLSSADAARVRYETLERRIGPG